MFFDNNIMKFKRIIINIVKKFVIINSIDAIIFLKTRFDKNIIQKLIYLRKIVVVLVYIEIIVVVHNVCLLKNKDFLFEFSNNVNELVMYVYFINTFMLFILIRNNQNFFIRIFKNYRLEKFIKIDFFNAFQIKINENVQSLTIKQLKSYYCNN